MAYNQMLRPFESWKRLSPEWRFAIGGFGVMRLGLTLWSLIVYAIIPITLQNLDLFGESILTVFDLQMSEGYVYSRHMRGDVLSFHIFDSNYLIDEQTGSIWSFRDGNAVQGFYAGQSLTASFHSPENIFPYIGVPPAKNSLLSLWQRFDANWYLKIATRGYDGSDGSTVYFPIYPLLIKAFVYFMDPMLGAMLISNLALVGFLVLFYRLAVGFANIETARRSLIYFLAFPTAFFLFVPYTESLFLLFTLGSLYAASQRRWRMSVLLGMLSALTRLQGILLVVPLAYMLWRETRGMPVKELILRALPLIAIPLATITFLAFTNLSLISTYQGTLRAEFVLPWENIFANVSLLMSWEGCVVDALNLVITIGLIVMMYFLWKKLPFEYTAYSLLMLLAPMLRMTTTQPLVSMMRYALAVFPVFIVLGAWGENRWVNRAVIYTSALLQLYLSAQFILWGWVA